MNSKISYVEQLARGLIKMSGPESPRLGPVTAVLFVVIIDVSGSMELSCGWTTRLKAAVKAVIALLDARQQLGTDDKIALISFNLTAQLVLPFTSCPAERKRIERALKSLRASGGTDLKAPLELVQNILPGDGQVHIVLLSDGHGGDPSRVAERIKKQGAIIETIGVGNDPEEVDERILRKTASVLDGQVLYRFIRYADELKSYFRTEIAHRLVKRG